MKLNERLKELREEKKYSQAYVADRLNVSRQAISKWENGWTSPDVDNLILLSELYGVQLEELTQFYYENHNDLKKESQNVSKEEPQKISLENNILLISITAIISTFIPFGGSIFCVWIFIKLWKKKLKLTPVILLVIIICFLININNSLILMNNVFFHIGKATIK